MSASDSNGVIGVDGGGTHCRMALLYNGIRSEVRAGATNVTTDLEAATLTICKGLEALAQQAGLSMQELRGFAAYLGLAGITGAAIARKVADALPLDFVVVEDDRNCAVKGALADEDGCVAGIGTGSFLARQESGNIQLMGGYGPQLGDEASGAWLGRSLLARVLLVVDGLLEGSTLSDTVFSEFDRDTSKVIAFARTALPREYAQYAPRIVKAGQLGDDIAIQLLSEGAGYIERGLLAMGWCEGEPLCLMGGLAPHYRGYLRSKMANAVIEPKGSALDGTLVLAARLQSNKD